MIHNNGSRRTAQIELRSGRVLLIRIKPGEGRAGFIQRVEKARREPAQFMRIELEAGKTIDVDPHHIAIIY